jgi:hypothetical protein
VIEVPVSLAKTGTLTGTEKLSVFVSVSDIFFSTRHNFRDFQGGTGTLRFSLPTSSVADPGSGVFLTPGSGMEKNPDPG